MQSRPPRSVSVDEVMRQLSTERNLRGTTELALKDLRREHARLIAVSKTRTHYVLLVPKPKWGVIRDILLSFGQRCSLGLRTAYGALKEYLWPNPAEE